MSPSNSCGVEVAGDADVHEIVSRGYAISSVQLAVACFERDLTALAPHMRRTICSNDKFTSQGLWPISVIPLLARRKTTMVLTPSGWFAICAASAIVMGAAIAFAA